MELLVCKEPQTIEIYRKVKGKKEIYFRLYKDCFVAIDKGVATLYNRYTGALMPTPTYKFTKEELEELRDETKDFTPLLKAVMNTYITYEGFQHRYKEQYKHFIK